QPQAQPNVQAAAGTVSPAAPPSAPATQAAQATDATAPPRSGVSLQRAVESVRATIELGARQGFSRARIELSPPSLGTIRIQLHRTDEGLTARVVTDNAATADTLSQGGDDLRRSLQQAGVNLLSLDIQARSDGGAQTQAQTQDRPGNGTPARIDALDSDQADAHSDSLGAAAPTTLVLPGGARVNVLA
ncbi:MAG: flagellar hook-length control protein FliK, partial [Solirubrobacterales bacterium]|nr:flagellar hook-length control protein FliK [Solirubrobacterales bacterium]